MIGEGLDGVEVLRAEEEVKGDAAALEFAEAGEDVRAEEPVGVGFIVDGVSDPLEGGIALEPVEDVGQVGRGEVGPGDDAPDKGVVAGEGEEPFGFAGIGGGLNGDRAVEAVAFEDGLEVSGEKVAGDGPRGVHPGVGEEGEVPEMLMGVDAHGFQCMSLHPEVRGRIRTNVKRRNLLMMLTAAGLRGSEARFPEVAFENLNGEKIVVPGGLKGERNVLLLGFVQAHQTAIDTWLKVLPELTGPHPEYAYYELPVISRTNPMMRWFINNGMRSGIPDKGQRARTITLYLDKGPFKKALGIEREDVIVVLVVDRAGKVWWRAEGPAEAGNVSSLQRFVNGKA